MPENTIDIDFAGSEPVQSIGGRSDRVPEGAYVLEIDSARKVDSKNGKPMINVWYHIREGNYPGGAYAGKRLMDNFVLPRPATDDSRFGLDRFHGLIMAIGAPKQTGAMKLDLDNLKTKSVVSEVRDDEYQDRISSKPMSFYALNTGEAAELLTKPLSVPPPTEAPAAAAAPATPAAPIPPAPVAADPVTATPAAPQPQPAAEGLFEASPAAPVAADPIAAVAEPAPAAPVAPAPEPAAPAPDAAAAAAALDDLFK